jgi:hypothetical protein
MEQRRSQLRKKFSKLYETMKFITGSQQPVSGPYAGKKNTVHVLKLYFCKTNFNIIL